MSEEAIKNFNGDEINEKDENAKTRFKRAIDEIEFFGAVDRKGKTIDAPVTSEYPAWYTDKRIEDLENEIEDRQHRLRFYEEGETKMRALAEISLLKKRHKEIVGSRPDIRPIIDDINSLHKELEEKIRDSMPSRDDMMKGLADPHQELKKDTEQWMKLDKPQKFAPLFKKLGIEQTSYQISRKQAVKVWKITGKLLGEDTNVERLRPSMATGVFKNPRSLREMIGDR